MTVQVALLRGVNAGGNPLRMARLREVLASLGLAEVRTYLQSGNVLFRSPIPAARLRLAIEDALAGETRLPVLGMICLQTTLARIVAGNPLLKLAGADRSKLHVTFLLEKPGNERLARLAALDAGGDAHALAGDHVYLHCPNGYGRSKLANPALERVLGVRATTRNWNTITALSQMPLA